MAAPTSVLAYNVGGPVYDVEMSKDGQYIAVTSKNKLFLFNLTHGKLWDFNVSTADVHSLAISGNGQYIACGDGAHNVTLLNRTSRFMWNYTTGNKVLAVALSQDGEFVVAGSDDNNVTLFYKNGTKKWEETRGDDVRAVDISMDGSHIVSGDTAGNVTLFDSDGYIWNYTLDMIASVAISADGEFIIAGDSMNTNVTLFDKDDGNNYLWSYNTSESPIAVDISADGSYSVSGGREPRCHVTLFNSETGFVWTYNTSENVRDVAMSADGKYFVSGNQLGYVHLFNRKGVIWTHDAEINVASVAISQDGQYFAYGAGDVLHVYYNRLPVQLNPIPLFLRYLKEKYKITPQILGVLLGIMIGVGAIIIFLIYKKR